MFYIMFIDFINKTNSYGICSNMCLFISSLIAFM